MTIPRFYPIVDTAVCPDPVKAAQSILEAGAEILQFRHKGVFSRDTFETARAVAQLCHSANAVFIVNDRADIAILLQAGVHLGQEDLAPHDAHRLVGDKAIIGFSTHNEDQLLAAADEPADYVALGPIFGTTSKDRPDPTVGVEVLRRCRRLTPKPLVAIGGITRLNALKVLEAGADSVAVIGDLLAGCSSAADFRQRTEEWLQLTSKPAPAS